MPRVPQVLIRLDARLINQHNHQMLASRRFESRQPSADPSVEKIVEAFGQASERLSRKVLDWSIGQSRALPNLEADHRITGAVKPRHPPHKAHELIRN